VAKSILPFLMFEGRAEEAMSFYVSLFPGAAIEQVNRHGAGGPAPEGSIITARFTICGQTVICSDSAVKHAFTFTPSISLFVECTSADEQQTLVDALAGGGSFLMPLDNYGFSQKFAWVQDRFGVSWQLNLA
jgi:predicted 3-demethylubiquinone-9 3-methyltransferase (glyoxalase superfamily)